MNEKEKKEGNVFKKIGYVFKKFGAGIVSGVSGIGQAALTEIDNEAEKGKDMSLGEIINEYKEGINSGGLPTTPKPSEIKEIVEETIDTITDEDKTIVQKATTIVTNDVSHAVEMAVPMKKTFNAAANAMGKYVPQAHELVKDARETLSDVTQNMQESLNEEGQDYDKVTQIAGDVGQVVGNMGPSIAVGAVTKDPTITMATMGISSKGQSTQEALQKGAELDEAVKIGNTKAMIDVGTEMLFGGVNIFGKGALDDIVSSGIASKVKNEAIQKLAEKGIKVSGEVVEETLSDVLSTFVDKGTIDPNATYTLNDFKDTAIITILSTGVVNGISNQLNRVNSNTQEHTNLEIEESSITNTSVKPQKKNFFEKVKDFFSGKMKKNLALPEAKVNEKQDTVISQTSLRNNTEYVNLTDYISNGNEHIEQGDVRVKYLNGKPTYKLENTDGLIWCAQVSNDNFYSEWEKVQPDHKKYAQYYEIAPTTYKVQPKDLLGISNEIQYMIRENYDGEQIKNLIVDYVNKNNKQVDIKHVMCEINEATDVADLHKLFNTSDIAEVVELYGKSFSAVNWKYIDEKDTSGFQVPTLMIMDSNCMQKTRTIETVPYQKRQNGTDKITAQDTMQINTDEIVKTLNSNLTLDDAVNLLKIKRDFSDPTLIKAIDDKLNGYNLLEKATQIVEHDKLANEIYIVSNEDKVKIKEEILSDINLQKQLEQRRLQCNGNVDSYMAVYVEMVEDVNRKKYLEPITKEETNENNKNIDKTQIPKTQTFEEKRNEFVTRLKENVNDTYQEVIPKFRGIEGAIQQYINSYIYLAKTENRLDPYKALVNIAGKAEQGQSHTREQAIMLDDLKQSGYIIREQNRNDGQVAFYHIDNNAHKTYRQSGFEDNIRLYINPDRGNTFELVSEILNKMGKNPIYLKFMSDEQMSQTSRNEKIVIYTNDMMQKGNTSNLNLVLNALNDIKKEKMNLFDGCEIMNPFMKTVEGIAAYAPEPKTKNYIQRDGKIRQVAQSYNSFLSTALDESLSTALNEMTSTRTNTFEGIQQLEKLMEYNPKELIEKVKLYLKQCQKNNPDIDIKGIENDFERDK